jgi:hypothetical protein
MLCLDVRRNGKKVAVIGVPTKADPVVGARCSLAAEVTHKGRRHAVKLHLFGFERRAAERVSLEWGDTALRLGDKVSIRAVEAARADPPRRRYDLTRSATEEKRARKQGARAALRHFQGELKRIEGEVRKWKKQAGRTKD